MCRQNYRIRDFSRLNEAERTGRRRQGGCVLVLDNLLGFVRNGVADLLKRLFGGEQPVLCVPSMDPHTLVQTVKRVGRIRG